MDYGADPGDKTGKLILWGGGGCLVLILLLGVIFSLGAGQCCDSCDINYRGALEPVDAFLHLNQEDLKASYQAMHSDFRADHSLEDFSKLVQTEDKLFLGGEARVVQSKSEAGARLTTHLVVQISDPTTRTARGLATFVLAKDLKDPKKTQKILTFSPGDPQGEKRANQRLQNLVDKHHKHLKEGKYELAHKNLSAELASGDPEVFKSFVQTQTPLLQGTYTRIVHTERFPDRQNPSIRIQLELLDQRTQKLRGTLSYEVIREEARWKINSFTGIESAPQPLPTSPDAGHSP